MSFLKALCCCNGQESEDEQLLNHDEHDHTHTELDEPSIYPHNGIHDDSSDNPVQSNLPKTREQVEQELLDKILVQTQQKIIDVSNYESYCGDVDVSERSAKYQHAVHKHDESACDPLPIAILLTNLVLDLPDVIQRPPITSEDINTLRIWNKSCQGIVKQGVQFNHPDDLVVCMNNDDDM